MLLGIDWSTEALKLLTGSERIFPLKDTYDFKTEFIYDNRLTQDIARQVSAEMMKSLKTSRVFGAVGA